MPLSSLLSLPEELVAAICAVLPVDALLSCGLTCKELHRLVKTRLEENKTHAATYAVCHDRLPRTVPSLLRLATRNSDKVAHIRAFESWGLRPGWNKWQTWNSSFYGPEDVDEANWPEPAEDHSTLDYSFFSPQEYKDLEHILQNILNLTPERREHWLDRIRDGWDEPLKAILFALTPRLDRLNFIAYDSWQGDDFHSDHPLEFLCEVITRLHGYPGAGVKWPAGFHSLRQVSVCTSTELRHPHDAYFAPHSAVAPLFFLPNIKILNLTLLGYNDDPDPDFYLPAKSSSVEDLAFSCCEISPELLLKFIRAPRNLRALTCAATSSGTADAEFGKSIINEFGQSLEHLSLDRYDDTIVYNLAKLRKLTSLDRFSSTDMLKTTSNFSDIEYRPKVVTMDNDEGSNDIEVADLRRLLPTWLVKFHIQMNHIRSEQQLSGFRNEILHALADLVEDEGFNKLKEVCLFPLITQKAGKIDLGDLPEAVHRIEAKGIKTHLRCQDGSAMDHNKHFNMHRDGNSGLAEIETDPRTPEQRWY